MKTFEFLRLWLASLFIGCAVPAAMPSAPDGAAAPLCASAPTKIFYGSCGAKRAAGPASCELCEGAKGCTAFAGHYCVSAAACDDPACK
jgi:hypothetical protein